MTKLPSPNQHSKRWIQTPLLVTPSHLQGKEAAINFPPLSDCARGELTVTPTIHPHAAQIPRETTALTASVEKGNSTLQQLALLSKLLGSLTVAVTSNVQPRLYEKALLQISIMTTTLFVISLVLNEQGDKEMSI